ncbi:MAG: thioredoxin [Chitinispirillia bacterium]
MAIEFTDDNFQSDVITSDIPVVVDFWAPWCGPCKMLTPIIEELSGEYGDKVKIGKLNTDENMQTATKYNIVSIPTVLFIKKGEVVERQVGVLGKEALKTKIDALL